MTVKKMTTIAILSALAIVLNLVIYFPIVPAVSFLKYDPKDIIIVISGFIYGPLVSFIMSLLCSGLEILYRGGTILDILMNVISTCAFACTAAWIYKIKKNKIGAIVGLVCGIVATTGCMLLWNYIITPIYFEMPREAVVEMLLPGILPFNLIKSGLNAAIALFLYKPIVMILRTTNLVEQKETKEHLSIAFLIIGAFVAISLIILILVLKGVF